MLRNIYSRVYILEKKERLKINCLNIISKWLQQNMKPKEGRRKERLIYFLLSG